MKLIDVEPIIKNLSAMKTQLGYDAIEIDGMIKALREAEEVTAAQQPNDPLTLEELREMDGEPVWGADGQCYIVNVKAGYAVDKDRGFRMLWSNGFFYRRKREEEDNETD